MLYLHTFGGLWLRDANQQNVAQSLGRKPLALLALLARADRHAIARDRAVMLLWPEKDQQHARNALNQMIFVIRRALGPDVLALDRNEVGLARGAWSIDVADFEAAIAERSLERAAALYTGPFLDAFYVRDAGELERWIETERAALRREYMQAVETLAVGAESLGDHRASAQWWQRLASAEPLSARFTLSLMRALASAGETAGAIDAASTYRRWARSDLESDGDGRIAALAQQLRDRTTASRLEVTAPVVSPRVESTTSDARADAALGGSDVEVRDWRHVLGRLRHTSALVASVVLAASVVAVAALARQNHRRVDDPRVLVAAFENRSGDTTLTQLGELASDWIAEGLARTGLVNVSTPQIGAWASPIDENARTASLGSESELPMLARRAGAGLVVSGTYYVVGDTLVFDGKVSDLQRGTVDALDPVTAPVASPLTAIESLRQRVMGALAVRVDSTFQRWATYASKPANFEAYLQYARGIDWFRRGRDDSALVYFRAASALDTAFTVPALWSVFDLANLGRRAEADSVAGQLDRKRGALAPWDRALLDFMLAYMREGPEAAHVAAKRLVALAPGSEWEYEVGLTAFLTNRQREGVEVLSHVDPTRGWTRNWDGYWQVLTIARHRLGEYDQELADARRYVAMLPNEVDPLRFLVPPLAALGRVADVDTVLERAVRAGSAGDLRPGGVFTKAVIELRAHGHLAAARHVADRFASWANTLPDSAQTSCDMADGWWLTTLYAERFAESLRAARAWRQACLNDPNALLAIALSSAALGQRATADSALRALDPRAPGPDAIRMTDALPLWTAARVAAFFGERERAVSLLREAFQREGWFFENLDYDIALERLRGYAPYDELMRPRD
jgi:serine/threonine-protein kinase